MPRKKPGEERKQRINLTLHPSVLDWIRSRSGTGKRFASVTHAVEYAVTQLIEREAQEGGGTSSRLAQAEAKVKR